jgi:hypothetical protein
VLRFTDKQIKNTEEKCFEDINHEISKHRKND